MATPNAKAVPLQMVDRTRDILIDMNAFCIAEDITGKNYMRTYNWLDMGFRDVRALTYAGLRSAGTLSVEEAGRRRDMTIEEVGNLLDVDQIDVITEKLAEAFALSMPARFSQKEDGEKRDDVPTTTVVN